MAKMAYRLPMFAARIGGLSFLFLTVRQWRYPVMWTLYEGNPFLTGKEQSRNVTSTDQYRCIVKLPDGSTCKRVELSYQKMCVHLAVEYGIRRQSQIDKSKSYL